jgi:predicted nucleic acid-binding protein
MISAIDTNILLDVFLPDKMFGPESVKLLKRVYNEGGLIISLVVYAELVPQFRDRTKLDSALSVLNISLSSMDAGVAFLAGERWGRYRSSGGKRKHIITDFLIGAHAMLKAERLLTRDRGFYRSYFPELQILSHG